MKNYKTFSSKHFNFHETNKIWRNINNDSDVESKISECERMIECKRKMRYLNIEDIYDLEKKLGEIEIAMSKILTLPNKFTFYNKNFSQIELMYEKLEKEINDLYLRMMSQE